ncbi:MAG: HEAT repeat domain-containing protein [Limisphaerales bacterium]
MAASDYFLVVPRVRLKTPSKVKKQWWILGFVLLAVIAVVVINLPPKEPVYQGRRLGLWLVELAAEPGLRWGIDDPPEQAIRAMGTNALPYLAKTLGHRESVMKRAYRDQWQKLPRWLRTMLPVPVRDTEARRAAAKLFADLAERSRSPIYAVFVAEYEEAAKSPDYQISFNAMKILGNLLQTQKNMMALDVLTRQMDSSLREARATAALWLSRCDGPIIKGALPTFIRHLQDSEVEPRMYSAVALYHIGYRTNEAVAVLAQVLSNKKSGFRSSAARYLSEMGPAAGQALPILLAAKDDSDKDVMHMVARALAAIDPKKYGRWHSEQLVQSLRDREPNERMFAAGELREMGAQAQEAVPALVEQLDNRQTQDIWSVGRALVAIAPEENHVVVPKMIEYLKHPDSANRPMGAVVLAEIGPEAQPAVAVLSGLFHNKSYFMRQAAAYAVLRIESSDARLRKRALDVLLDSLSINYPWYARRTGAVYLAEIGSSAQGAVPSLVRLLDDDNEEVAKAAGAALKKIDPEAAAKAGVK